MAISVGVKAGALLEVPQLDESILACGEQLFLVLTTELTARTRFLVPAKHLYPNLNTPKE